MGPVVGALIVVVSVVVGYLAIGGNPDVLCQPAVFLIVVGSAAGALLTGGGVKGVASVARALSRLWRAGPYDKHRYSQILVLMHDIFVTTRRNGVLALEAHIERPANSQLFQAVPLVASDPLAMEFITDYLRLIIGGNFDAMQLEALMDIDIAAYRDQAGVPSSALAKMADSLPAFGVVAAITGAAVAVGTLNGPPEVLGQSVGVALMGSLLGIVLAYGVVGPLSGLIEQHTRESAKLLETVKMALIASLNGYDPATATEFGRKGLFNDVRPSFYEMESLLKQART